MRPLSDRDAIYRILFGAILEIREQGAETKNAKVFHFANLIHELTKRIKDMDEWKLEAADVLRELHERPNKEGIEQWVESKVSNLRNRRRNDLTLHTRGAACHLR